MRVLWGSTFILILAFTFMAAPSHADRRAKRVLIIGTGSIGIMSAYFLHQKGHQVILVDKARDVAKGASEDNGGFVMSGTSHPLSMPTSFDQVWNQLTGTKASLFEITYRWDTAFWNWSYLFAKSKLKDRSAQEVLLFAMGKESAKLHREIQQGWQSQELIEKGRLEIFTSADAFVRAKTKAELLWQKGVRIEAYEKDHVHAIFAHLGDDVIGAIFYPDDFNVLPHATLEKMTDELKAHGVKFQMGTEVFGFRVKGQQIAAVQTTAGEFFVDEVVLAAGHLSPVLSEKLGIYLPVEAGEGMSIILQAPANAPLIPTILGDSHVLVVPLSDGTIKVAGYFGINGPNPPVKQAIVDRILAVVKDYLPFDAGQLTKIKEWQGLRPCTPDTLPILGRVQEYTNLILATGHGTLGMHLGPITGKIVSEIVSDEPGSFDIEPLSYKRFL